MPTSAWIMLVAGSVVIYGGLAVLIMMAVKSSRKQKHK